MAAVPIVFATKLILGNSPRVVIGFDSLWTCTSDKLARIHSATGAVDLIT
ncbi:MAG: hypothetical protein HY898_05470 [Deltaproteobacteria bacterium]|nr:hypothetical protein [Deltaproteobacteria bacterium]